MTTITPHDPAEEARPVPLRDVESELARRVRAMQEEGDAPLLRARMSNLVIFCDDPERAKRIADRVPALAQYHPARMLLLIAEPQTQRLSAYVAVRERAVGTGRTAATEWITLRAGGPEVEQFPYAVRQLLLGNLPVNLCWVGNTPAPMAGPLLGDLAEGAQQVIYDSYNWPDPARLIAATTTWLAGFERNPGPGRPGWRIVTDLNWRRLRLWRRLLTQALDPAVLPDALKSITELDIEHGPDTPVQGWLLAGWLASRLGWTLNEGQSRPGTESTWRFAAPQGNVRVRIARLTECPNPLQRVRITCKLDGHHGTLSFAPEDDGCRLAVCQDTPGCVPRTVTFTPEPLPQLVGRQLSDRDRDPVFHDSMTTASAMARAVLS